MRADLYLPMLATATVAFDLRAHLIRLSAFLGVILCA
jgi:hypothetical protein